VEESRICSPFRTDQERVKFNVISSLVQCINQQWQGELSAQLIIYRCKTCGSLLEVQHDFTQLAQRDAKDWMKLFDERYKSSEWPYAPVFGEEGMDPAPD